MSKIGKKPIVIPQGVTVTFVDGVLTAKGPKGELQHILPTTVNVVIGEGVVQLTLVSTTGRLESPVWGLTRALLQNMITGVSDGFKKTLEFQGVGFKASVKNPHTLEMILGFSHPVVYTAPEAITFVVEKNVISISGSDRQMVGHVAAEIRAIKKPEPYKGTGIKYSEEVIRRKAGKKAVAAG